eukprot:SAG31_NODE_36761_length_310_cov_1.161137_1_plen_28_part_01
MSGMNCAMVGGDLESHVALCLDETRDVI